MHTPKSDEEKEREWTDWNTPKVGMLWVCSVCGRTARTRTGEDLEGNSTLVNASHWDTSCFMHAVLCYADKKEGKWQAVKET